MKKVCFMFLILAALFLGACGDTNVTYSGGNATNTNNNQPPTSTTDTSTTDTTTTTTTTTPSAVPAG